VAPFCTAPGAQLSRFSSASARSRNSEFSTLDRGPRTGRDRGRPGSLRTRYRAGPPRHGTDPMASRSRDSSAATPSMMRSGTPLIVPLSNTKSARPIAGPMNVSIQLDARRPVPPRTPGVAGTVVDIDTTPGWDETSESFRYQLSALAILSAAPPNRTGGGPEPPCPKERDRDVKPA
jgi:hypothetical protein